MATRMTSTGDAFDLSGLFISFSLSGFGGRASMHLKGGRVKEVSGQVQGVGWTRKHSAVIQFELKVTVDIYLSQVLHVCRQSTPHAHAHTTRHASLSTDIPFDYFAVARISSIEVFVVRENVTW